MRQWATKQIKTEIYTTRVGFVGGALLVVLLFFGLSVFNWMQDILRTHDVADAEQARAALEEGWIARIEYSDREYLGSVTVETTNQGETVFMIGGAVGAIPGAERVTEQEYQLWALQGEDFAALYFSEETGIPASGILEMEGKIEWLPDEDRQALEEEFSEAERPAYVFLRTERTINVWMITCFALLLVGGGWIVWMCTSRRAMKMTKFWKRLAAAGDAERILTELDEPLYSSMGFAISTNYVYLNESVLPRAGLTCQLQKDDAGDALLAFAGADGRSMTYYPDEEDMETLRTILHIKE